MTRTPHSSNRRPPYCFYTFPVLALILCGLLDTGYLAWLHYRNYTDPAFTSFCALTKSINCDTVAQSPWSILLGLPLAVWGILAYLVFLVAFLPVSRENHEKFGLWYLLFFLALLYSGTSLYLGYISATQIKAHCILCMASYAISFALLFSCWIIIRRFIPLSYSTGFLSAMRIALRTPTTAVGIPLLCGLFALTGALLPPYWHYTPPPLANDLPHGFTEEGHPWIGAESPRLTIHEYTDYQCFQCSKMHIYLRRLIATHPQEIRLVHHHYPMDHAFNSLIVPEPFHVGSGKMAMLAIYAGSQGKFWKMNDALYTMGRTKEPFNTRTLATMSGISGGELAAATRHPQIRAALLHEIREGMKLNIIGTPTFVIDGKVYPGAIPTEILARYL
nr:vitamin K epoxide reductase family protein [uncultured Desulfobulbus sp.]